MNLPTNDLHAVGVGDVDSDVDDLTPTDAPDDRTDDRDDSDVANIMVHRCHGCGEENEVLPPRGYRFTRYRANRSRSHVSRDLLWRSIDPGRRRRDDVPRVIQAGGDAMKRTPVPRESNSHPPVVRATVVESHIPPSSQFKIDEIEVPETGNDGAPWSDVPVSAARKYIRDNPDAAIEIIFPTVYEEDRSKKLEDLAIAETAGTITHQRMAEQMAKELGFDNYDYDGEMRAIELERQTLPPFITRDVPETTGLPGSRPATGVSDMPAMPDVAVRRADVSGDQKARFRRQRKAKTMEREVRRLQRQVRTLSRRVAEAKPPVVNVTVEPQKAKHLIVKRDERGLLQEMREVMDDRPGPDKPV